MKEIKAFVRRERANRVLDALGEVGVVHVTLTHVTAVGPTLDPDAAKTSVEFGRPVSPMIALELICPDRDEARLLEIIRRAACTGLPGDGVIAVHNINRLVKIRSGAESVDAL